MKEHKLSSEYLMNRQLEMAPLKVQFKTLFWRVRTFAIREPIVAKGRIGMTIFLSSLIMFVFWKTASPNGYDLIVNPINPNLPKIPDPT